MEVIDAHGPCCPWPQLHARSTPAHFTPAGGPQARDLSVPFPKTQGRQQGG